MSRTTTETLPATAKAIALLLASTPSVQDAQPGVLHQLLEFANRYTIQVLTDARVYAEHAGRQDKIEYDDVVLAVQARVGWEFGGRVPKEYTLGLASQMNKIPLPAVPEVFGVRLPPTSDCLTSVDFDLVPQKPPPTVKLYDEEVEEIEESESEDEEDVDMEPAPIPEIPPPKEHEPAEEAPFPISAYQDAEQPAPKDDGSDADDDELFAGGDDDGDSDAMEQVQAELSNVNGVKRKLQEDDEYD